MSTSSLPCISCALFSSNLQLIFLIGLTVWLVKESVYNLKEFKILQAICEDISLRAFDSTLILMITLKELIDCCLLSQSSWIVVHAQGRSSTHSGILLDPPISLYFLSAEEQSDAVLCNPQPSCQDMLKQLLKSTKGGIRFVHIPV